MVNKKLLASLAVVVLLALGIYFFVSMSGVQQSGNSIKVVGTGGSVVANDNVIEINDDGFSPSTLTISAGDTVTFVNKGTQEHWPASGMHPTHTNYAGGHYDEPGSFAGSLACSSEGVTKDGAFDACKGLAPGESYKFTFYEKGTWGFHDHLNARMYGKIVVQ